MTGIFTIPALIALVAAAAIGTDSGPPPGANPAVVESLLAHNRILAMCVLGSIGGGFLSAFLMGVTTARAMAARWVASGLCGVMFAPAAIRWLNGEYGLPLYGEYILCVSAAFGIFGWGVLQIVQPLVQKFITRRIQKTLRVNPDTDTPPGK